METKELYEKLVHGRYKVFFGEKGVSMSEADHKANLLKERAKGIQSQFDGTGAYTGKMQFHEKVVATDMNLIIDIDELAHEEGNLYALSAWLREGIKAKNELLTILRSRPHELLLVDNEKIPEEYDEVVPRLKPTTKLPEFKLEDAVGTLSVADRAKYLSLEAKAAHLGKKIHPGGKLATIREELMAKKVSSFTTLPDGVGDKSFLVEYAPLYDLSEIDKLFFKIQEEYRSMEQQLNYLKAQLNNLVTEKNAEIQKAYNKEYDANAKVFRAAYDTWSDARNRASMARMDFTNQLEERRYALIKYVAALKIIIPNDLQALSDSLDPKRAK